MAAAITVTASRLQHHSREQVRAANDFCCFGTAQAHRWPALPHRGIRIFAQALLLQIIIHPSRHRRSFCCKGAGRMFRSRPPLVCRLHVACRRQMLLRVQMPVHLLARLVNGATAQIYTCSIGSVASCVWARISE